MFGGRPQGGVLPLQQCNQPRCFAIHYRGTPGLIVFHAFITYVVPYPVPAAWQAVRPLAQMVSTARRQEAPLPAKRVSYRPGALHLSDALALAAEHLLALHRPAASADPQRSECGIECQAAP